MSDTKSTTKPSAGASLAADKIIYAYGIRYPNMGHSHTREQIALTIDRETGVAVEALKMLWGELQAAERERRLLRLSPDDVKQIEQAIAKCEGSE
jgi:hypothetical protein